MATASYAANFQRAVKQVIRDRVTCATCKGRPGIVDTWPGLYGDSMSVDFMCHGALERVDIAIDLRSDESATRTLRAIPRRVFLRRMATTGPMSESARRERRGRWRR